MGLRGYGQRNPLLEYKREALQMFLMMSAMRDETLIQRLLNTDFELARSAAQVPGKATARQLESGNFRPVEEALKGLEVDELPLAIPAVTAEPPAAPQPGRGSPPVRAPLQFAPQ